jgi:hypothetical protein
VRGVRDAHGEGTRGACEPAAEATRRDAPGRATSRVARGAARNGVAAREKSRAEQDLSAA